jgi:hypothetical protein
MVLRWRLIGYFPTLYNPLPNRNHTHLLVLRRVSVVLRWRGGSVVDDVRGEAVAVARVRRLRVRRAAHPRHGHGVLPHHARRQLLLHRLHLLHQKPVLLLQARGVGVRVVRAERRRTAMKMLRIVRFGFGTS